MWRLGKWGKTLSVLKCKVGTVDESFKDTFVYGQPESQNKYKTLDLLKGQKPRDDVAWLCMGGFNEVMGADEK